MNESLAIGNWTLLSTTYLDSCIQYIIDYLKDAVEHLILFFIAYITLCIALYLSAVHWKHIGGCNLAPKRVLFVVAHPDDECMFFGPTIIKHTSRHDCQVYLLCLSKGLILLNLLFRVSYSARRSRFNPLLINLIHL